MPKQIYDPIHGFVELSTVSLQIVDTPIFQRLRKTKQLGVVNYVFPSANHTRFEHSIGVGYLAKKMLREIRERQPELAITEDHLLCVEIAGLCHDLGHGPWSHLFDDFLEEVFLNNRIKDVEGEGAVAEGEEAVVGEDTGEKTMGGKDRSSDISLIYHEKRSISIFKHLVKTHELPLSPFQVKLICDMIHPSPQHTGYLYQIVANRQTGIDVDKFDYLMRDCYFLGFPERFDYRRISRHVRVINGRLCYSDKSRFDIYDLFLTRYRMHVQVYRHPVVQGFELLHLDMLKLTRIDRDEWCDILKSYYNYPKIMTDHIFDNTEHMLGDCLPTMKMLRQRLDSRNGYVFLGEILCQSKEKNYQSLSDVTSLLNTTPENLSHLERILIIQTITLGYSNDPVENVPFYHQRDYKLIEPSSSNETSYLLPNIYSEKRIRWWSRSRNSSDIDTLMGLFREVKSNLASKAI